VAASLLLLLLLADVVEAGEEEEEEGLNDAAVVELIFLLGGWQTKIQKSKVWEVDESCAGEGLGSDLLLSKATASSSA
jgi:hypothetical protein